MGAGPSTDPCRARPFVFVLLSAHKNYNRLPRIPLVLYLYLYFNFHVLSFIKVPPPLHPIITIIEHGRRVPKRQQ